VDYELHPTVLTVPTGSAQGSRQCVTVSVNDDVAVENDEYFHIILTSSDARVEVSSICQRARFTIIDADGKTIKIISDMNVYYNQNIITTIHVAIVFISIILAT
jgi:hypothetical protein